MAPLRRVNPKRRTRRAVTCGAVTAAAAAAVAALATASVFALAAMMAPAVTGAFVLATPSATTRPMAAATACRGGSALLALGRVRGGGWNPRTNRRDTQLFFQRQPTRGGGGGKGSSTPTTTSTTPKPPAVPTEGEAVVVGTEVEDSEPLTLTSAIALVAGTTVGAGILALPAFTIKAGFLPSSLALTCAWVYMATTGLLIAETSLNLAKGHRPDGGLISMASRTIGPIGAQLAGLTYVFLHYALLVAYIAQGGDILQGALHLPPGGVAPVAFTAALGGALAFGDKKLLDKANDALVGVVVLTFMGLVALAAPRADVGNLLRADFGAVIGAVPVMFVALVFHNVVPVISYRLKGDAPKIRTAILAGSGIPLLLFLVWNAVVLGNVGPALLNAAGGSIADPLAVLRRGGAEGEAGGLGTLISAFSEAAVITSFTGFVYGLKDFLKDALFAAALAKTGTRHLSRQQDLLAYALILIPPLAVAIISPDIFFSALDNAGAFGIACLFGIYPAAMAYITRQRNNDASSSDDDDYLALVPGGTPVLVGVGLVAVLTMIQKTLELATGGMT